MTTTPDSINAAMHTLLAAIRCAPTDDLAREAATMAVCLGTQALQDIAGKAYARDVLEAVMNRLNDPGRMVSMGATH